MVMPRAVSHTCRYASLFYTRADAYRGHIPLHVAHCSAVLFCVAFPRLPVLRANHVQLRSRLSLGFRFSVSSAGRFSALTLARAQAAARA